MSAGEPAHAAPFSTPFSIVQRIYYQHTDAGGVVYHANYLSFMEAARTELLHRHGFELAALAASRAIMFIVHKAALSFRRPARLHDLITITARPSHVGRARIAFEQNVFKDDDPLAFASIELACVDTGSWRPVAVPEDVRVCMLSLSGGPRVQEPSPR